MREIIKNIFAFLAKRSIHKYNTNLIIIYGWDWSEILREGIYHLLSGKGINIRRNPNWIKWDLGMPIAILGYDYDPKQTPLQLIKLIIRSIVSLIKPSKYENYVILSLHARNKDTFQYWFNIKPIKDLVILPEKGEIMITEKFLLDKNFDETNVIDLRSLSNLSIEQINIEINEKLVKDLNAVQRKIFILLKKFIEVQNIQIDENKEIIEAILKIDWNKYFISRIKDNLNR